MHDLSGARAVAEDVVDVEGGQGREPVLGGRVTDVLSYMSS